MARVVLHRLSGTKKALDACRLVEHLYRSGRRVLVWVADRRKAGVFDQYLWTFADQSFVPHALCEGDSPADEPVAIVSGTLVNPNGADVLVVLDRVEDPSALPSFTEVHDFLTPAPEDSGKEAVWESWGFEPTEEKGVRTTVQQS